MILHFYLWRHSLWKRNPNLVFTLYIFPSGIGGNFVNVSIHVLTSIQNGLNAMVSTVCCRHWLKAWKNVTDVVNHFNYLISAERCMISFNVCYSCLYHLDEKWCIFQSKSIKTYVFHPSMGPNPLIFTTTPYFLVCNV